MPTLDYIEATTATKKRLKIIMMKNENQIVKIAEELETRIEANEAQIKHLKKNGFLGSTIKATELHLVKLQSQLEGIKLCF